VTAGLRLDDALRGFLAEQGTKRASKEDLWTLVTATQRLRLTAHTLAGLRDVPALDSAEEFDKVGVAVMGGPACLPLEGSESYAGTPACVSLRATAAELAGFYGRVADEVGHPGREAPQLLPAPPVTGPAVPRHDGAVPSDGEPVPGNDPGAPHRLHPHLLWVQEHLHHLSYSAQMITEPALHVAQARRQPWWR
jgi:hypothetical protein